MLCNKRSSAEVVALHEKPSSKANWPSYTQGNKGEWQGKQSTSVDSASLTNTGAAILEGSPEPVTVNSSESCSAGNGKVFGVTTKKANALLPVRIRKMGFPLTLLFSVGLLAVCLKYQSCSKEKEAQITPDARRPEKLAEKEQRIRESAVRTQIRARLKKVKTLLPAAERLASAIGTVESRGLLATVQGIVGETELTTRVIDNQKLEKSLEKALEALRSLHEAAIKQGNTILQANKALYPIPSLKHFMREHFAEQMGRDRGTDIIPDVFFVLSYQGIYESAARQSKRFSDALRRLTFNRQFKNEEDGDRLMDAALATESLCTTSENLRQLSAHASQLQKAIALGIQIWLLMEHEKTSVAFEVDLHLHQAYAASVRDALKDISESQAHHLSIDEVKAALDSMERDFEQGELLIKQIETEVCALRECRALPSAMKAAQRADALEAQGKKLLMRCSTRRKAFADLKLEVSLRGSQMLNETAKAFLRRVKLVDKRLRQVAGEVESRFASSFEDFGSERKGAVQYLNGTLVKSLLQTANEIVRKGDACVQSATALQEKVKRLRTMTAASHETLLLKILVHYQEALGAVACVRMLRLHLVDFLESEIERLTHQAVFAALHDSHLTAFEKQRYAEARNLFNISRKSAAEADNLLDAIQAVDQMRSHAIAMADIFFKV